MEKKIKILSVFGTRPEVIKLAPFIKAVESDSKCISITCATTQQRELQNDILSLFEIKPDYDLDIMKINQDLPYITNATITGVTTILERERPDFLVIQGDTTTAFASALASYYKKIPVVHIEAGLRTNNIYSPFPEEANRALISKIATLHMTPTPNAQENLKHEGIVQNVFMVGNTIVDSVQWGIENFKTQSSFIQDIIDTPNSKVLITLHRRENFGEPLHHICEAIEHLCQLYPNITFVWPIHPNPNIKVHVKEFLAHLPNLRLIEPLAYNDLLLLMNVCKLILSDSGGIQEEASILGKNIIILRENTERIEIVHSGIGVLVGYNKEMILKNFTHMIQKSSHQQSTQSESLYGAPGISQLILNKIKELKK